VKFYDHKNVVLHTCIWLLVR